MKKNRPNSDTEKVKPHLEGDKITRSRSRQEGIRIDTTGHLQHDCARSDTELVLLFPYTCQPETEVSKASDDVKKNRPNSEAEKAQPGINPSRHSVRLFGIFVNFHYTAHLTKSKKRS